MTRLSSFGLCAVALATTLVVGCNKAPDAPPVEVVPTMTAPQPVSSAAIPVPDASAVMNSRSKEANTTIPVPGQNNDHSSPEIQKSASAPANSTPR